MFFCSGGGGGSVFLRLMFGDFIAGFATYLGDHGANNRAKVLGFLLGLPTAKALGFQVQCDCKLLVFVLQDMAAAPWRLDCLNL